MLLDDSNIQRLEVDIMIRAKSISASRNIEAERLSIEGIIVQSLGSRSSAIG